MNHRARALVVPGLMVGHRVPSALARAVLLVGSLAGLAGCPNPNSYTTPRTLPPGKVQLQVAAEVLGTQFSVNDGPQQEIVLPMLPTVGARIGALEGFDVGVRLQNLDSLALDGKVRLLKGRIDLAVDPGVQGFYSNVNGGGGAGVMYVHLPLLVGWNVSRSVSIVASPGAVFADITKMDESGATGATATVTNTGWFARFGLGVSIRAYKDLSIQPEITAIQQTSGAFETLWVAGVGFNVGAQADYSDVDGSGS
jgi:hypothetical protein